MEDSHNLDNEYIYNRKYIGEAKIGNILIGIDIPPVIVINLRTRPDRAKTVVATMESNKIPFAFYKAEPHENPIRGCLESHIGIVKWASRQKYKAVCIFEDDFIIQHPISSVPFPFPDNWDMIYLGGLCTHIKEWGPELPQTEDHNFIGNKWIKGVFYCDHAYIIKESVYQKIIDDGMLYTKELDRFYTSEIHASSNYNVYMPYVQYVVQASGWSDIDNKHKWENWKWPNPGEMFNVP